nr:ATP-binding protein [Lachnospiraceae bacterium]
MYYRRKIDDYLSNWKADTAHKPLIVKGPRQIGKTESIMHFAKANYENVVYINFALEKKFSQILADGYDVASVIKSISLADPSIKFLPNKTVIIFDEIQENPDVATTLKSFNDNESVPAQLAKENKKFQFNKISKNARSREYTGCIEWLIDAGVITECNCLQYPELPLKGNIEESKYKLYYPDTGLLVSALDAEAQEDLRVNKNLGVYKGALYENF